MSFICHKGSAKCEMEDQKTYAMIREHLVHCVSGAVPGAPTKRLIHNLPARNAFCTMRAHLGTVYIT
jgi:hypothetical protein